MRTTTPPSSWASDLRHPLPLAAVAVLAVNDHLLKGAHLLPGWLTGKLSDFAGLFFFPVLLVALARGARRLAGRAEGDRRTLASAAVVATGVVFTLLKLDQPFNTWMTRVWGVNVMDATDLWALPMLPLSAAFMLRRAPADGAASTPARRFADFAAVLAAGLASAATSAPPPEPKVPPQQAAVAAPASGACASLEITACERAANLTYVVVDAAGVGPNACPIAVTGAHEIWSGNKTAADLLPARISVDPGQHRTFALTFLRPVEPNERFGPVRIALDADRGTGTSVVELGALCTSR
jgi:hypothetical protein